MKTLVQTEIKLLDSNAFKVIAILSMLIDHLSVLLVPDGSSLDILLHTIGRLAAPIMCYMIAEGYFHTSNLPKYMGRLFLFALISHFPFVLFFDLSWWEGTSVIWDLLMGLVALSFCLNGKVSTFGKVFAVILCCLLAWTADWNYIGVLWVVCFGVFRGNFRMQMLGFTFIGAILYIIPGLVDMGSEAIFRLGILLTIPLFILYSGKRGKKLTIIKWGFYMFYPLHLLILYFFRLAA